MKDLSFSWVCDKVCVRMLFIYVHTAWLPLVYSLCSCTYKNDNTLFCNNTLPTYYYTNGTPIIINKCVQIQLSYSNKVQTKYIKQTYLKRLVKCSLKFGILAIK
jgi:hypothetical protein